MARHAEEHIEAAGTVVFLLFNIGSKSEMKTPFLYVRKDTLYALYLQGDNPFENAGLLPYDGKRVRVSGTLTENTNKLFAEGTLIADTIEPDDGNGQAACPDPECGAEEESPAEPVNPENQNSISNQC